MNVIPAEKHEEVLSMLSRVSDDLAAEAGSIALDQRRRGREEDRQAMLVLAAPLTSPTQHSKLQLIEDLDGLRGTIAELIQRSTK
jgi:hypothetical protein